MRNVKLQKCYKISDIPVQHRVYRIAGNFRRNLISKFRNFEISVRFRKYNSEKYFRKIEPEQVESKPHGSLSLMIPSSSIAAANCEVGKIMKLDKEKIDTGSGGKYSKTKRDDSHFAIAS